MKTKLLLLYTLLFSVCVMVPVYSQEYRGRYYDDEGSPGLPPLDFTGYALLIGAALFGLGWLISNTNKKPNGEGSSYGGCLIFLGIICALPALFWLQTIVASLYVIGIIGIIIIGVLALIWGSLTGKK